MKKGQIIVIERSQNGSKVGSIVKVISPNDCLYYDNSWKTDFYTDYYRLATEKERRYRLKALKSNPNKTPNIKNMKK